MRTIKVCQGTDEWHEARLGIPTASQFHRLITAKRLTPSSSQDRYIAELLTEEIIGEPIDQASSVMMERGRIVEWDARKLYEAMTGQAVSRIEGFVKHDDLEIGCSPDFLVGDDGGGEIKCRSAVKHVEALLDMDADRDRIQIQGSMWVTGREWWERFYYHPTLPPKYVRIDRDENFVAVFDEIARDFLTRLELYRAQIRRLQSGRDDAA